MRIAFIVTSFWAYGELLIALQFAEELRNTGNQVLFIVPPTHKENVQKSHFNYVTLIPKFRKMNQILFTEISQSFHPELVVLSDFLNYSFADRHYGVTREDLNLLGGKLATFDNFNWELKRRCMDTYGFGSDIPKRTNVVDFGEKLLPCPLVDCDNNPEVKGYRYGLITNRLDTGIENRKRLREKYGFSTNPEDKIILVSFAQWQESHIESEEVTKYINVANHIFANLIRELSKSYTIICIGKQEKRFAGCEHIYCYDSMPSVMFDEYAILSDAYIGRNMTSTTMIKLALSDLMCFDIINSYVDVNKIDRSMLGACKDDVILDGLRIYRYMMFPVGWYHFLKPLFDGNRYSDVICILEEFKLNETLATIHELLNSKSKRDEVSNKVEALNERLSKLPKATEIVDYIIHSS